MTTFVISMIIVGAVLAGTLFGLLRGRRDPMGSPEVLERARQRNRELEAQEKRDDAAFYRGITRKLAEAHGRKIGS